MILIALCIAILLGLSYAKSKFRAYDIESADLVRELKRQKEKKP